jgi:hypothetical protein
MLGVTIRTGASVLCLVVAFALLGTFVASGAPRPTGRGKTKAGAVFSTAGPIRRLAADGSRAAALTTSSSKGDRIVVWTAPGSGSVLFKTHVNSVNSSAVFEFVSELALGGGRVAWIEGGGGNTEDLTLYEAPVSGGPSKMLDFASNSSGAEGGIGGDYVGQLYGAGPLLFYDRWTIQDEQGHVGSEKLLRISGGARVQVKSGPSAFRLRAVGGGRLSLVPATQLVLTQSGTTWAGSGEVHVVGPGGVAAGTIPPKAGDPPRAIALSATHLVIKRKLTLDSYDPVSGTLQRSIPLGADASLALSGATTQLALLRGLHRLVVIKLSTSVKLSFPLPAAALACFCPVGARLTDAGLFFAYNVPAATAKGRIVFEPTAQLLARF